MCPLCRAPNEFDVRLKPYTAGVRGLWASSQNIEPMARYLQEMRILIGLNATSLSQHFDIVIGADAGALHRRRLCRNLLTFR
jgi:hypothetical protein